MDDEQEFESENDPLVPAGGVEPSDSTPSAEPTDEVGLDGSQFFAADRVFERLGARLERDVRTRRRAESDVLRTLAEYWQAMVDDEGRRGRRVPPDGAAARAFALHLSIVMKVSRAQAGHQLRLALQLRDALPTTAARFAAGDVDLRAVQIVAAAAEGIADEALPAFDAAAADVAPELPPKQLERKLERIRNQLDHAAAEARETDRTRRRGLRFWAEGDGQAAMLIRGPQTDLAAVHDVLHQAAVIAHGREGETRNVDALMVDGAIDLILGGAAQVPVDPTRPSTPEGRIEGCPEHDPRSAEHRDCGPIIRAELLVVLPADTACGEGHEEGTLSGFGPVSAQTGRRITSATETWTRVTVDPVKNVLVGVDDHGKYVSRQLKKALWASNVHCQSPWCGTPGHRCDVDHVVRRQHGGPTTIENLHLLCRRDHQIKDDGYVQISTDFEGNRVWRTRWGGTYVAKPVIRPAPPPPDADDPAPF